MRKKIKSEAGLSVTEMLVSTVVLAMLALIIGTGMQMTVYSYKKVVAQSEVDLLLSTAVDAIANDLRYARDVETTYEYTPWTREYFTYTSDTYGNVDNSRRFDNKTGQLIVTTTGNDEIPLLPDGAYGDNGTAYQVESYVFLIDEDDPTFAIHLKVQTPDKTVSASTPDYMGSSSNAGVIVHCLNSKAS